MTCPGIRVAVDIGGTFTDLVAHDPSTGALIRAKTDTTPGELERGVLGTLKQAALSPSSIAAFVHGTTIVINALTERSGARTALVTTAGFRDVLEIGRANRPDLYNLAYRKPASFVPRHLRFEVAERMSYRGEVIKPPDEVQVMEIAARLAGERVDAVAICLLHAWANPAHERRVAAMLALSLAACSGGVTVVASHQVSGQWREYERTSTTVLSAYVQPVVTRYLGSLRDALRGGGMTGPMYAMRSNGGVCSFERAASAPVTLLESGPAAGVTAAAELGRRIGARHVLALDIGGTTAKTAAVRDGQVRINALHQVAATPVLAGYPVQAPTVDIIEIGAGGGSIVWADPVGGLHVGPRSAGAEPGPACYGRGGTEPTLTDANLLAGRLDADYFLGGTMPLDLAAAEAALRALGARLGTGPRQAARGVLRLAVTQMSHALRLVTVRRGHDPRDFVLVAYGGAGPLHAALLARQLGIGTVVIPPAPGHFSAFGMLAGEHRADAVHTMVCPLATADLRVAFAPAERAAVAELDARELGAVDGEVRICRYAELRYQGQEHTIEVPVESFDPQQVRAQFNRRSLEAYAFRLDAPLEVVSLRVSAVLAGTGLAGTVLTGSGQGGAGLAGGDQPGPDNPPSAVRMVDLDPHGGRVRVPVLGRSDLAAGERFAGPCVIEEAAATTLVLPGQVVAADDMGNLVLQERR
jgi:N-methylhydantoinase A